MTQEQFVYWLQGFAEISDNPPTAEQWKSIKEHLGTVFNKVTPTYPTPVYIPDGGSGGNGTTPFPGKYEVIC